MAPMSEQSDSYASYVTQLEKRVLEQEQLIGLLNEKLAALQSSSGAGLSSSLSDVVGGKHHVQRKAENRNSVKFMGSRKSDVVSSVVTTKYSQYFVSRINPVVSAEAFTHDLMSSAEGLTSIKCSKMKTRHSSYTSFHVVIPADQCSLVEKDSAWPEGSFVKIFEGRLLPNFIIESFDSTAPLKLDSGTGAGKVVKQKTTDTMKSSSAAKTSRQTGALVSSPLNGSGSGSSNTSKTSKSSSQGANGVTSAKRPDLDVAVVSPKNLRPHRNAKYT